METNILYHNGRIFTANKNNEIVDSLWIKKGIIQAVGNFDDLKNQVDAETEHLDLEQRVVMPGLIDSHMHPFWGGKQIRGCNLNYEALTVEQIQAKIQAHLDADPRKSNTDWLKVTAWQRQAMMPAGADMDKYKLDQLDTIRPVVLFSNDCHTLVVNSQALKLLGLNPHMTDPPDGKIGRNDKGELTGVLEDAPAMRAFDSIPDKHLNDGVEIAKHVQYLLNEQGVTTIMDARVFAEQLNAFKQLQEEANLTVRVLGAREITPDKVKTPEGITETFEAISQFIQTYHSTAYTPDPSIHIHHIKFFVDGVLQAPIMTASLLQPYRELSDIKNQWIDTDNYGDLYFTQPMLNTLFEEVAKLKCHPHCHTVGEGAIELVLNAVEHTRQLYPNIDLRPGLAHNELVAEHQFARFCALDAIPVLSFQWAGLPGELIEFQKNMIGNERFENLEPIAKFIDNNIRVAYGSDWPIDRLDEWYNLQIAMTRQMWDCASDQPAGPRLNNDRNLTLQETLRAATIDAAYMLGMDNYIGSLETGKFADFIVLEEDLFSLPSDEIHKIRIHRTILGGRIVYPLSE